VSETRDLHIQVTDAQAEVLLLVLAAEEHNPEEGLWASTLTDEQIAVAKELKQRTLLWADWLPGSTILLYGLTTNGRAVAKTVRALRERTDEQP